MLKLGSNKQLGVTRPSPGIASHHAAHARHGGEAASASCGRCRPRARRRGEGPRPVRAPQRPWRRSPGPSPAWAPKSWALAGPGAGDLGPRWLGRRSPGPLLARAPTSWALADPGTKDLGPRRPWRRGALRMQHPPFHRVARRPPRVLDLSRRWARSTMPRPRSRAHARRSSTASWRASKLRSTRLLSRPQTSATLSAEEGGRGPGLRRSGRNR